MPFSVGLDISALDPSFREHAGRGIGRYVSELKRYFEREGSSAGVGFFDHRSVTRFPTLVKLAQALPFGRVTIRQQLLYPVELARQPYDALHIPAHMDAPSWSMKRCIVTVLDLIPLIFKELYAAHQPGWRYQLARWLEIRGIRSAALIIAISEQTKRDVVRLLQVPEERIIVTPLGVDERFSHPAGSDALEQIRRELHIPPGRKVVLYVGGIDPRKNVGRLVESFRAVLDAHADAASSRPLFVFAGRIAQDREFPRLQRAIREARLDDDVLLLGYIDDSKLPLVYRIADVFVFPSLYEGFGLPPLEAMACGTPVVSSNTSAMAEVLGDAALGVDPTNVAEMAHAIQSVLTDTRLAHQLRAAGPQQAARFRWEETGRRTLAAYRQLGRVCEAA